MPTVSPRLVLEPPAASHTDPAASARRTRRSWTSWEDQTLRSRVAQYGDARGASGRWKEIACGIPGRTAKDCRKRWFHSLDPSLRKGKWTQDEDRILLDAYARLGPSWHEIASLIPGRKDDQCSKRYNDILDPLAQRRLTSWTPEEDGILREGVRTLGHRWAAISARLPGRPPLTCRNRWRNLSKQQQQQQQGQGQGQQSSPGTSDQQLEQGNEPFASEHEMFESPESPAMADDLDMVGAMGFQDAAAAGLGFEDFDPLGVHGIDVSTDPNLFHNHLEHVSSHGHGPSLGSGAGDLSSALGAVRPVGNGAGMAIPQTQPRERHMQHTGPQLQGNVLNHHPPPSLAEPAMGVPSHAPIPTSLSPPFHNTTTEHHVHHATTEHHVHNPATEHHIHNSTTEHHVVDDAAIQSQLRATEQAAEEELGPDQQAAPGDAHDALESTQSRAAELEVERRTNLPLSSNASVHLHHHHHHHHHYHHHHHHHHYHHYPF